MIYNSIYEFNIFAVVGILKSEVIQNFVLLDIIAVYLIGLPIVFDFLIITSQEIFKIILLLNRILLKKWIANLVHDIS